jgi:hypothetical protein
MQKFACSQKCIICAKLYISEVHMPIDCRVIHELLGAGRSTIPKKEICSVVSSEANCPLEVLICAVIFRPQPDSELGLGCFPGTFR